VYTANSLEKPSPYNKKIKNEKDEWRDRQNCPIYFDLMTRMI